MPNLHRLAPPRKPSAAMLHDFGGRYSAARSADAVQLKRISNLDDVEVRVWRCVLDLYLAGWAEVDPDKIIAATAPGYCFDDPFVGEFSQRSLPSYFRQLQARFATAGTPDDREYAFCFRGPTDQSLHRGQRQYFREAPALGLTGVSTITIGECGIVAERVAYDLNLASDVLRRQQPHEHAGQSRSGAEVLMTVS